MKRLFLFAFSICLTLASCKKEYAPPSIMFTNNIAVGTADVNGDYAITGHISAETPLEIVTVYKRGDSNWLYGDSTVHNKTEYDFSYLIKGVYDSTLFFVATFDARANYSEATFMIVPHH